MDAIKMIVKNINIKALNEETDILGYQPIQDPELAATAIVASLTSVEHACSTLVNLYRGNVDSDTIQSYLDVLYPGCTARSAAHHLCRFRHPEKYRPKHTPRYQVSGGRSSTVKSVSVSDDVRNKLAGLLKK